MNTKDIISALMFAKGVSEYKLAQETGVEVRAKMIALIRAGDHYALRIETTDLGQKIYEPLSGV